MECLEIDGTLWRKGSTICASGCLGTYFVPKRLWRAFDDYYFC